ncbi:MAG: SoxR reducing system RseC family protein [Methylophilaceae bacterium]
MIEEHAVILTIEQAQNETPPMATLEVVRKTACGLCGKTRGCGNAIWGKLFVHKTPSFKAQNTIDAKVGQSVIIGIDENALMKSALLLYVVPLVTMFIGTILALQFVNSDLAAMSGAAIGLLIGYFWIKAHTTGRAYYQSHQPKILRLDVVEPEEEAIKFQ